MGEKHTPAFPGVAHYTGAQHHEGMSLRDWFAGQALAGFCANTDYSGDPSAELAEHSYRHADAMLAERERTE